MAIASQPVPDPSIWEVLASLLIVGTIMTVIGGAVLFSVIGAVLWLTAPMRRRRRGRGRA